MGQSVAGGADFDYLAVEQGKELAMHQSITAQLGTSVFFCDAHSPWQRGSNENMNGLLRDYFQKSTDLSDVTQLSWRGLPTRSITGRVGHLVRPGPADLLADLVGVAKAAVS